MAVALAATTVVAVAVASFVLLSFTEIGLPRRLWLARNRLLGPESVGIWRSDPRFGWRHIPGVVGHQRSPPDFDVTYRIDEQGHRRSPGGPTTAAASVLFLGGSITFGHGVEDHEPYPALLQAEWPDIRVVNAATNAWGTAHALLALEDELLLDPDVGLVVYGFITVHLIRNHRSAGWLQQIDRNRGRRNPLFAMENGEVVFRGLADPTLDSLPDGPAQRLRENAMTVGLLAAIERRCLARGIPLVVVNLPDGTGSGSMSLLRAGAGASTLIDLEAALSYRDLHFEHDPHYTAAGHRQVAQQLRSPLSVLVSTARDTTSLP